MTWRKFVVCVILVAIFVMMLWYFGLTAASAINN